VLTLLLICACSDPPPLPAAPPAAEPVAEHHDNGNNGNSRPEVVPFAPDQLVELPPLADLSLGLSPYPVPVPDWMVPPPVPADNALTHAGVALGRLLFYDPLLSGNNTQSCGSCHHQSRSFTDGRVVSVGSEGRPLSRNAMALINLAWTAPYFWDGRAATLEALVTEPITHPDELNQAMAALITELEGHSDYPGRFETAFPGEGITEATISKAIAQFLRTLVSFNSRADLLNAGLIELSELEMRGNQLMVDGLPKGAPDRVQDICDGCHTHSAGVRDGDSDMGLFTSSELKSNGLGDLGADAGAYLLTEDESDRGLFVVPSIRNLTVTAPYMHDGRFATLDDVVAHYDSGIVGSPVLEAPLGRDGQPVRMLLDEADRAAVVAMLGVFTDEHFLTHPAFSDPFAEDAQ
jgi:cytochrome c peroxidase